MGEWSKALGVALILALSAFGADRIATAGHLSNWIESIIGASIGVILITIANKYSILRRFTPLRRRAYRVAAFEGFWLSLVDNPDRPYSVSKIYLSPHSNIWRWRGFGFSDGGEKAVEWKARSIHYDKSSGEWFFRGKWKEFTRADSGQEISGAARDQLIVTTCSAKNSKRMTAVVIDDVYETPSKFVCQSKSSAAFCEYLYDQAKGERPNLRSQPRY